MVQPLQQQKQQQQQKKVNHVLANIPVLSGVKIFCMAAKLSRMRPQFRGCPSHLVCLPEGWRRTKEQHVPVCLISLSEVCCTCRQMTQADAVFVLAQAALLPVTAQLLLQEKSWEICSCNTNIKPLHFKKL